MASLIQCAIIASLYLLNLNRVGADLNFDSWDKALQANTYAGIRDNISINIVNYTTLSQDDNFHKFISEMQSIDTSHLSYHEFYALFINAYNALAMKMIIDNPCTLTNTSHCEPIASMWTISPNVFDLNAGIIGGVNYTLDEIETFLRKPNTFYNQTTDQWQEIPLLHSCIVCGGCSCPNVRRNAFTVDNVTLEMADNMQHFLNNTKKGKLI